MPLESPAVEYSEAGHAVGVLSATARKRLPKRHPRPPEPGATQPSEQLTESRPPANRRRSRPVAALLPEAYAPLPKGHAIETFLTIGAIQVAFGFGVMPATWTRRVTTWMNSFLFVVFFLSGAGGMP